MSIEELQSTLTFSNLCDLIKKRNAIVNIVD